MLTMLLVAATPVFWERAGLDKTQLCIAVVLIYLLHVTLVVALLSQVPLLADAVRFAFPEFFSKRRAIALPVCRHIFFFNLPGQADGCQAGARVAELGATDTGWPAATDTGRHAQHHAVAARGSVQGVPVSAPGRAVPRGHGVSVLLRGLC